MMRPALSALSAPRIGRCPVAPCRATAVAPRLDSSPDVNRRASLAIEFAIAANFLLSGPANAVGFQKELKKKKVPLEAYSTSEEDGLLFYDLVPGSGKAIGRGDSVTVHWDVKYKSLVVVSSRQARLLGGNRSIAEPYEFEAGGPVGANQVKLLGTESAGGLFSGAAGPKPPKALSTAVLGMKDGGKRSIIVTPTLGYGEQGFQEIPAGESFEMVVEVLEVRAA